MCSIIGLLANGIIGLGGVAGERAQPRALTAGEDDGLHETLPAVWVDRPSRNAARASGT